MQIQELRNFLSTPKKIVITSHRNPDGDAIGSTLGLKHYLKKYGHDVVVAFPSEYPIIFEWMPEASQTLIFDLEPAQTRKTIEAADLIFALDFNALERIDKMGDVIRPLSKTPKVMIDHHRDPEPFADFMLSDITASSTSELVYDFIVALGDESQMDKTIGECLYTGIVTDTGSFRFATSPKLFRTVAKLVENGVDDYKVQDLIHNNLPEKNLRLLGHVLANRMEILPDFKTGLVWLTKKDYEIFDIQRGDTEGIVNSVLSMKDVRLACFITEQPTIVKISMRSKGAFNVQEFCKEHFNGGGHKNASGGYSYASLKATTDKFKNLLPQFQSRLLDEALFER